MSEPTYALSVRAPWWWWILHGGKDIENRTRRTYFRGPLLIHASKWWSDNQIATEMDDAAHMKQVSSPTYNAAEAIIMKSVDALSDTKKLGGHIVGVVDLVGCVQSSRSSWKIPGSWGWEIKNPVALENPFPVKGRQGLFPVGLLTAEVNRIIEERLEKEHEARERSMGVLSDGK